MKILVVDDSLEARQLMQSTIKILGHSSVLATSGKEGVELFKKEKPDIVTMDMNMPKMNGIDTLKIIMRIDSEAKVIMSTTNGYDLLVMEAIRDGASGYVLKPISIDTLEDAFDKVLSGNKEQGIYSDEFEKDFFADLLD